MSNARARARHEADKARQRKHDREAAQRAAKGQGDATAAVEPRGTDLAVLDALLARKGEGATVT